MLLHTNPLFLVYFGTAKDKLMQAEYLNLPPTPILELAPFSTLKKTMQLQQLFFAHQVHGDQGIVVDKKILELVRPFKSDSDFLVTDQERVGIGVMTADCLPIVFHDRVRNVVGVAHAGWRGAVLGVGVKAMERMYETFGSKPENIAVFFGPSAKMCCYKVNEEFQSNLEGFADIDRVLQQHGADWYFDLPMFNKIQLESAGISKNAFQLNYNCCTMCDDSFYSHRLQGESAGRQMTVVCLT